MSVKSIGLSDELQAYVERYGVREPDLLARLRDETARSTPIPDMQISAEQGGFMALLVRLLGARRCIEIGTFTGYSSIAVALAMPPDGRIVCCDVSKDWTDVARRYWAEAGVADKVDLRLGPAVETIEALIAEGGEGTFDFAFIDADKVSYPAYYEGCLRLLRPGGLVAIDNVFRGGEIADPKADSPEVRATRELNERIASDDRVTFAMVPIADGLTLARRND